MELVNRNLVTLKCVIFAFFGGIGCLMPFLPLHMLYVGLNRDEARIISIVSPCVALLGPLIAGPLADKLSVGKGAESASRKSGSGKTLRHMIAGCFILAAIFYLLLLAVPTTFRHKARRPLAAFTCDEHGATVYQEVCTEPIERTCNRWDGEKSGILRLSNCIYSCSDEPQNFVHWLTDEQPPAPQALSMSYYDLDEHEANITDEIINRLRREEDNIPEAEPPHLCRPGEEPDQVGECQVYTEDAEYLDVKMHLNSGSENVSEGEWCSYPHSRTFRCTIPTSKIDDLRANNESCKPVVRCRAPDPYDVTGSVLADAECIRVEGNPDATFWLYLIIRSIADIFPTAALGLVCTACIVATRDTNRARDDVGRQLAFGAIALAIFPPLAGLAARDNPDQPYLVAILVFALLLFIGALILIIDNSMPLSPPEWWWHTATGMLAMPINAIKKYNIEIVGVSAVLTLLGILWSALDSFLPWTLADLQGDEINLGLTITVSALIAIPVLWWAETIIDYCGHSNMFILAFLFYAVRFVGMSLVEDPWWALLFEAFELITLTLVWMTAVLYMRHLIPRKYLSSGQALAVVTHFCIGRCIGAIIGGLGSDPSPLEAVRTVYRALAVVALIAAAIYLPVYHLILAPRCIAPSIHAPILEAVNGNGNSGQYSPLRVYHNERAKKGQFRY